MSNCTRYLIATGMIAIAWFHVPPTASGQDRWVDLFAGHRFDQWERLGKGTIESNWAIHPDGWIELQHPAGNGTLVSVQSFEDFELSFFWKIAPDANSGIKYRVRQFDNLWLGLEYQLLDDQVGGGKTGPKHKTATLYDIQPTSEPKPLNPPLQVNHSRILVRGDRIEHWLNGQRVVVAMPGSTEWHQAIANSKFSNREAFGENRAGRLLLTDHGGQIWFRDVLLKPLGKSPSTETVDPLP